MKKFLLFTLGILIYGITTMSNQNGITGQAVKGCDCHGSKNTATTLTFSGIPTTGYIPGTSYTCTLKVENSTKTAAGFDLTASSGTLTPGNDMKGTASEITHKGPLNMSNGMIDLVFTWKAPAAGSGDVTFNYAGNAVNKDGNTTGDAWNTGALTVMEDSMTAIRNLDLDAYKIYPNPSQDQITLATDNAISNLQCTDQMGRSINLEVIKLANNKVQVQVEDLIPGVYFLQWNENGKNHRSRFQKI